MNSVSSNNSQGQNPSFLKNAGAVLGGGTVAGLVLQFPPAYLESKLIKSMQKISDNLSADEFKAVNDAAEKILTQTKLSEKGVRISRGLHPLNKEQVRKFLSDINSSVNIKFLKKLKKENIQGENNANMAHYEVGQKVRKAIADIGGTMPEELPTPKKSLKQLEKENKKALKKK